MHRLVHDNDSTAKKHKQTYLRKMAIFGHEKGINPYAFM